MTATVHICLLVGLAVMLFAPLLITIFTPIDTDTSIPLTLATVCIAQGCIFFTICHPSTPIRILSTIAGAISMLCYIVTFVSIMKHSRMLTPMVSLTMASSVVFATLIATVNTHLLVALLLFQAIAVFLSDTDVHQG